MSARRLTLAVLVLLTAVACKDDSPTSPNVTVDDKACEFEPGDAEHWTDGVGTFTANSSYGQLSVTGSSSGDGACTGAAHFKDRYRVIVPESQALGVNRKAIATARVHYVMDGSGKDNTTTDAVVTISPRYGAGGLPQRHSSATTSGRQDEIVEVELEVFLNKRSDDTYLDSRLELKANLQLNTVNDQNASMNVSAEFLGIRSIRLEDGTSVPNFEVCSASDTDWKAK